jgi:hypothetical protein
MDRETETEMVKDREIARETHRQTHRQTDKLTLIFPLQLSY